MIILKKIELIGDTRYLEEHRTVSRHRITFVVDTRTCSPALISKSAVRAINRAMSREAPGVRPIENNWKQLELYSTE